MQLTNYYKDEEGDDTKREDDIINYISNTIYNYIIIVLLSYWNIQRIT